MTRFALVGWLVLAGVAAGGAGRAAAQVKFGEKTYAHRPEDVLPEAHRFERADGYWRGYDEEGRLVGYAFRTDDLVEIPGYSGQTIDTLVGMAPDGTITRVEILRHAEPIVLIGLSERVMHEFVSQYAGKSVTESILIGDAPRPGVTTVDGISGATVTAVAINATVLEAARRVARAEGVVAPAALRTHRPASWYEPLDWSDLVRRGVIGTLAVDGAALGLPAGEPAIELYFAVLDPPAIGRNLLGERFDAIVRARLAEGGGSALYIGARGPVSFKGAGFARGGIFDRFAVEQAGELFVFRDLDYVNLPELAARGAPRLDEGGVFFLDGAFDPAEPFTLRLTLPYHVGAERRYATFLADYRLAGDFLEGETPFWLERWRASIPAVVFFVLFVGAVAVAFALRQRLLPYRKWLHRGVAVVAAVVLGLWLKAQPSTTQILTLVGSVVRFRFPTEIFLSEPLIFLFWITIVVSLFVWGRGFFCGWLCPYGALLEALIAVRNAVLPAGLRHRLDRWNPPKILRFGKYATFAVILAVSFVSLPLAEALDEVEPFKTFVLRLARPAPFVAYFVLVTLASLVSYRLFCRFLCPLGGALALVSKKPALPLLRYDLCATCRICAKGCEPRAISFETGRIDYRECLQCWDCQATGKDETVCPELIVAAKEKRPPRVLVASAVLALLLAAGSSEAKSWTVAAGGPPLETILAKAAPGDVVTLAPGVHEGPVRIDRPLVLRGEPGAVLDGGARGDVVVVAAPKVTVEGLTLRNCEASVDTVSAGVHFEKGASGSAAIGNTIEGCRFGVWLHGAEDVRIVRNRIEGVEALSQNDRGDCIHLWDTRRAVIEGNEMADCRDGIYMELSSETRVVGNRIRDSRYAVHTMWCDRSSYRNNDATENLVGLALMFSDRIEAAENVLHNNATHGLLLVQVTRGRVHDNLVIGNTKGLFVYNSLYGVIARNLVAGNELGLHYWGGSEENDIEANAFVGNAIQVKFVAARDQAFEGNFWSDYAGWDVDGDGRGDVVYRSSSLVDALLWSYPAAKFLFASPALQLLALIEREFPVIAVPKAVDPAPLMAPPIPGWAAILEKYPARPKAYYGRMEKLPHVPGEGP